MTTRWPSGGPYEEAVGYSRAVQAGPFVFVSGCTSVVGGEVVHAGDAYAQAQQAIRSIAAALEPAGLALADVVRTRTFVTDIGRWAEVARAHREAFGVARPAASMVEVSALIDPAMLVEIEAVAYREPRPGVTLL